MCLQKVIICRTIGTDGIYPIIYPTQYSCQEKTFPFIKPVKNTYTLNVEYARRYYNSLLACPFYPIDKEVGYKILLHNNISPYYSFAFEVGKTYEDANNFISSQFAIYPSGFHVYYRLRDAVAMAKAMSVRTFIYGVTYKKPVAYGLESKKLVVVTKDLTLERLILEL